MSGPEKFCGTCGEPIDSPGQRCLASGELLCAPEELMSEETLRATVRQFVKGITYASYYASGKGQVTLSQEGREAVVKLQALVSLEDDEERKLTMPSLRTPEQWAEEKGIVVVDPDGWREDGYFLWDKAISEEEFDRRAAVSTTASRKEDGSW